MTTELIINVVTLLVLIYNTYSAYRDRQYRRERDAKIDERVAKRDEGLSGKPS